MNMCQQAWCFVVVATILFIIGYWFTHNDLIGTLCCIFGLTFILTATALFIIDAYKRLFENEILQ